VLFLQQITCLLHVKKWLTDSIFIDCPSLEWDHMWLVIQGGWASQGVCCHAVMADLAGYIGVGCEKVVKVGASHLFLG
jgi:hypothetical protein